MNLSMAQSGGDDSRKIKRVDLLVTLFVAVLFALVFLFYLTSCRPCDEIRAGVDTVRKTVVQVDTLRVKDTGIFNELQRCYQSLDSVAFELSKCKPGSSTGLVVNNTGKGTVKVKAKDLTYSMIIGDNNQLRLQNARLLKEKNDYQEKLKGLQGANNTVKTPVSGSKGPGCPGFNFWPYLLVFCLGFGTGGYLAKKFL